MAVSLSVSTDSASLPIAYKLNLPETWSEDPERRRKAGVPDEVVFCTRPLLAAEQMQRPVADGVPRAPVLRPRSTGGLDRGLETLPPKPRKATGRPPKLRQRAPHHQPVSAQDPAAGLHPTDGQIILWRNVTSFGATLRALAQRYELWRNGTRKKLESRFASVRVRPANRDFERSEPLPEQWLLIEWPPKRMAQMTRHTRRSTG